MEKISDISSESTVEEVTNQSSKIIEKVCDWTQLYGELEEGEYEFVSSTEDDFSIRIKFTINADGKLSYNQPTLE